ncbi:MAG: hypothetical protein RBT70_06505 [Alphaproteobacteria bacterium]|jgi:prepilin signal peptidase PulO-like enzyme (type II secretory pathway)|nr:hypothetical protein [Alphaproteobacteria bacterium]
MQLGLFAIETDIPTIVHVLTAGYPPEIWFVPSLILAALILASLVDGVTGRVPDWLMGLAFFGGLLSFAYYAGWLIAGERLLYVIGAVFLLRMINLIYAKFFGQEAFGFGDAKWTGLAVLGFGLMPVFWAWIVGAWLGLIWLGVRKVVGTLTKDEDGVVYVHFAPFLFLGLIAALFVKSF